MKPISKILLFAVFACSSPEVKNGNKQNEEIENQQIEKAEIPKEETDYSTFKYDLPGGNYFYNVKILKIETSIQKDAFTTKKDEYSKEEKIDGYHLSIHIEIENPFPEEKVFPVPDYFYISSLNGEWFSSSTTWSKFCQCYIDNSTRILTQSGKDLFSESRSKCGYDDWCIDFLPNESKRFIIQFKDPIFSKVRKLAFSGFNFIKMKRGQGDKALIIDVDKNKVVGLKTF